MTDKQNIVLGLCCSAVVILASTVFPRGASAQTAADWDKVVAAAKSENQVVFYSVGTSNAAELISAGFTRKFGIPVDLLKQGPSEVRERIRSENMSGRKIGDVVNSGNTLRVIDPKLVQPHGDLPNLKRLIAPFKDDGTFLPMSVTPFGLLINTNLVKTEDIPKSWNDLLDAKWKGKMIIDDPRRPGQGNGTLMVLMEKLGKGYIEKLAAQNIALSSDNSIAERRTAQGEYAIYFAFSSRNLTKLAGLPVTGAVLEEGVPYSGGVATVIANPAHPNAARVFMNYLLDDEAQDVLAAEGTISTTGRTAKDLPATVKALLGQKLIGESDGHKMDDAIAYFKTVFK